MSIPSRHWRTPVKPCEHQRQSNEKEFAMPRPQTRTANIANRPSGAACVAEMKEFAGFTQAEQRYIRRALGLGRRDGSGRWPFGEASAGRQAQAKQYRRLAEVRAAVPDDIDLGAAERLMAPLISLIGFDLAQGELASFAACRFLYERLVGAAVRPFLPAAFCAAAALPHLHPERRHGLLRSIGERAATAAGWSNREPTFFPEWIDGVEPGLAG
jgi:hypothetical protein